MKSIKSPSVAELIFNLSSVIDKNRNTLSVEEIKILTITINKLKEMIPKENSNSKKDILKSFGEIVIPLLKYFLQSDVMDKILEAL